ncbi:MAG: hypothetical protein KJZ78_01170 [Bryobacteraceae bacterium]|nr:hypothetical protein [Bryobacteraceae bacterium]
MISPEDRNTYSNEPAPTAQRRYSDGGDSGIRSGIAGDLLICFGSDGNSIARRSSNATWSQIHASSACRFLASSEAKGWHGLPLTSVFNGHRSAWLFGEVFPTESGIATIRDLLATGLDSGESLDLNGHFLLVLHDTLSSQWHVWTDRFGTCHAYYGSDGKRAAIGTFHPAVADAASRRELDWLGLSGFFSWGFFPDDRTHFGDVQILRPATHYTFDSAGQLVGQHRYWQWWHRPNRAMSFDDAVTEFARRFDEVIADHVRGERVAVPISGGLDSRSTVAALPPLQPGDGSHYQSYSYGYSRDSVESAIARRIAAARGLPFESFTIEPYLFDRLDQAIACLEGFQDVTQARQLSVAHWLKSHSTHVLAAHWGDVWLDDMGMASGSCDPREVAAHALRKVKKRGGEWLLDYVCRPHLAGEDVDRCLAALAAQRLDELKQIDDPDFRIKAFKTDQWSARWTTASLRAFRTGAIPRLCFYDTRLADFFCTVPTKYVAGRRLQVEYLKRFAPDLARVTWQVYDANLYHYQFHRNLLLPKRAWKKLRRTLSGQKVIERNWEVQFLNESGRRGLHEYLIRPGLKLHDLVAREQVQQLVDDLYHSPDSAALGYSVSMLLTFSAWLEQYG